MGGDDSQKLLPWRGTYSSLGRSKLQAHQNEHSISKAICAGPAPTPRSHA